MKRFSTLIVMAVALVVLFGNACQDNSQQKSILIFHAGSLSYPFMKIAGQFMTENPGIKVITEAAGSVASARKITELKRQADIFASADYQIIDQLLIPEYTAWNIQFASNSIVIAYNDHSKYADKITADNWLDILKDEQVNIGSSDPDADPCGYRSVLCLLLAEKLYDENDLINKLLAGSRYYQRPKETDLIALLETKTIDYLFIYKSVAIQHGMHYVELNDSINLSNPALNNWYANTYIDIRGSQSGTKIRLNGEAITYGITLLADSKNQSDAWQFISWLLHPEKGGKILKESGQQPITPALINSTEGLPTDVMKYVIPINNLYKDNTL